MNDSQQSHSQGESESQEQTKQQRIEIRFHVFTIEHDEWTDSLARALGYYKRFKRANKCARLYIEIYSDRENDEMMYENCLLSIGDYPT